jgi:Poly(ADP-ribose) polymerase catalytic domain/WWE domain
MAASARPLQGAKAYLSSTDNPTADCIKPMTKEFVEIMHDTGDMFAGNMDHFNKFVEVCSMGATSTLYIQVVWAWEEDRQFIANHEATSLIPGTNFVKYPDHVSVIIESSFQHWIAAGKGPHEDVRVDLNGYKFRMAHTGSKYTLCFQSMIQVNEQSDHKRQIRREVHQFQPPSKTESRVPKSRGWFGRQPPPDDVDVLPKKPWSSLVEHSPHDIGFLPTYQGQVIEITHHDINRKLLYGNVVFDPRLDEDATTRSYRLTSGAFPSALSRKAEYQLLADALTSVCLHVDTYLSTPLMWEAGKEGCIEVARDSPEWHHIEDYFKASLDTGVEITHLRIERVQIKSLWQAYAVKRREVEDRFAHYPEELVNNKGCPEEKWLFHGTTTTAVDQILDHGFNRSFAGHNGATYGKGSYFARDASYSCRYAVPDSSGIQHVFMCRMVVGDWCSGSQDQLTPNSKPGGGLYDSTVDDIADPEIFVSYHDAQVYPEYLLSLRLQG